MDTTATVFTLAELWYLQSRVRHEMQGQETWKFPPVSLSLNDAIAEAILFCETGKVPDAALMLSFGDTLLLDAVVDQSAKTIDGVLLGKNILLKSFVARGQLRRAYPAETEEPPAPSRAEVVKQLKEHDDA